jgi:hypothetical protein
MDDETLALITTICSLLTEKKVPPVAVEREYKQACKRIEHYRQTQASQRTSPYDDQG